MINLEGSNISLQERKAILARAKELGLKLSEDGRSWLPIDANSASEYVADLETSESLDPGVKLEPKLGTLALNYLAFFAVSGLAFGLAMWSISINDNIILFFSMLLITPIIYAVIPSNKLGKEFDRGVVTSLLISLPISIWSYYNELKHGCFCFFSCTCPPTPYYYDYPRFSALIMAGLILIYSIVLQIKGKKARGFGVFVGLIISFVIFMAATVIGFWS